MMKELSTMFKNRKGMNVGGIVGSAIGFLILFIVVINVLFPQYVGANTTDWSTAETALFSLVGIMLVIAIVIAAVRLGGGMNE